MISISVSIIGLAVIIASWLIQLFSMRKGRTVNKLFVLVYMVGVGILVYDGYVSGLMDLAIANLLSLVAASLVLTLLIRK